MVRVEIVNGFICNQSFFFKVYGEIILSLKQNFGVKSFLDWDSSDK